MLTTVFGKNVLITDAMKQRSEKKLAVLDKYFKDSDQIEAKVLVKVYNSGQKVEVNVHAPVGLLRAEVMDRDFYNALDHAVDKLEDQIRRQKTRLSRKHREKLSVAFINEMKQEQQERLEDKEPVRTKVIDAQLMDLSTAIMTMEMLHHDFFIYTDDETEEIAVVYARKEGGYGLLEVEKARK